jgi:hypothetical protein
MTATPINGALTARTPAVHLSHGAWTSQGPPLRANGRPVPTLVPEGNVPLAGPLWGRRFWLQRQGSFLDDTLHDEGGAEALDAGEGGEALVVELLEGG